MNNAAFFNLTVLRGARFVASYQFSGTRNGAMLEAKRIQEIHAGAAVSVESKSGLVVGVAR